MPKIISFGQSESKTNIFKIVWTEIIGLNLFTKLTIVIALLIPLVVIKTSGELLQKNNYASLQTSVVNSPLPPNCHFAVDFTECSNKYSCQPKPKIVCDTKK